LLAAQPTVIAVPRLLQQSVALALMLALPQLALAIQCNLRVNPINFGVYEPLTPVHLDVIGQIQVRCQAQPGTFSVSIGPGLSGDFAARSLSAGGQNLLFYNLFRDAARTQIWGDGTPPTFVVAGSRTTTGRPSVFNYPIYGRIFANQAPDPGLYTDNLVITVLF
jgi:spore coat protein U-like protein